MHDIYQILTDDDNPYFVGDIYPSNQAPIFTANSLLPVFCKWGFENYDRKLLINVRAETVTEKPMFSTHFLQERCVIPCNGFYEWDSAKNKYCFTRADGKLLYLCGFCKATNGLNSFAILTKSATPPVAQFHHRIPVIVDEANKNEYLQNTPFAKSFVNQDNNVDLIYG
ncbi:MAG: SOS response-associated peptidase family protein [Clostridiales bacterium]|nr:SOS response-associated peptidase family protein [Clostridiales bacterium]